MIWNITFTTLGDLPCYYFITHMLKGRNGSYANADNGQLSEGSFLMMQLACFMYLSQQGVHITIQNYFTWSFLFSYSPLVQHIFVIFLYLMIWALTQENLLWWFSNNKDADQPAHTRSLISTFLFDKWKVSYLDWLPAKFQIF